MPQSNLIERDLTEQERSVAYFDRVHQTFQHIEQSHPSDRVIRYFHIANAVVCFRFIGTALVPKLTRAIAHLETDPVVQPDLTICLTSQVDSGYGKPAPAWRDYQYQRRGEVRGFVNDRIYTAKQWGSDALVMLDSDRHLALYWVDEPDDIPYWESGAPLQSIFNIWFGKRQVQLVHGAFVGYPEGGILLVGKGGSGKSTTALSCVNSDLQYGSDDYCLITPTPQPMAFSLYGTGKKNADDLDRLSFLKSRMSNPDRLDYEKAVYFIHELFPEKMLTHCPLKAVFIPRVTGKTETTIEPTTTIEAMSALVPSTIMQLGGAGKTACHLMHETLSQLPCYYLNVGTDIPEIAKRMQAFLQEWP